MKVLLCSPYKTSHENVGGITIWSRNIFNHYHSLGNDRSINLDIFDTVRTTFVDSKMGKLKRVYLGLKEYSQYARNLNIKLSNNHYEAIHLCTSASISLVKDIWFARIAHKHGVKVFIHFHFGRIPQIFESKNWEYRLLVKVLQSVEAIIVMDLKSYDVLKKHGYIKIFFLPNPLSQDILPILKAEKNFRNDREIIFVGHVLVAKGVRELVNSVKLLGNAHLKLYGRASAEVVAQLREMAGPGSDRWLEFMGVVPYTEVIKAMCHCELFCLPSYTEGFPYVILESMACECTIVSTFVGAIPEMLAIETDSPCGLCIEPQDEIALYNMLEYCLEHPIEVKKYGREAKKRVFSQYTIDNIWNILSNIWQNS